MDEWMDAFPSALGSYISPFPATLLGTMGHALNYATYLSRFEI